MKPIWGIDLGGTKIEGAVFSFNESGINVIDRRRVATEADQGYNHIINQIKKLIDDIKIATGLAPDHIGISAPGTVEPSNQLMKNCNSTAMNGQAMLADIQKKLAVPITMINDANCLALAEAKLGIVKEVMPEARVVFGVIMGSGIGGGVIVNDYVVSGGHGIGGEWGHNFLDASGGPCYCGKLGCVETVLSGPALQKFYEKASGEKRTMKEIYQLYKQGSDLHADLTMKRLFSMFGKAISVVINILDPDAIVIGGGLGNIEELYTLGVKEIEKHIFNNGVVNTKILKPKLGDSAGVFGAALA